MPLFSLSCSCFAFWSIEAGTSVSAVMNFCHCEMWNVKYVGCRKKDCLWFWGSDTKSWHFTPMFYIVEICSAIKQHCTYWKCLEMTSFSFDRPVTIGKIEKCSTNAKQAVYKKKQSVRNLSNIFPQSTLLLTDVEFWHSDLKLLLVFSPTNLLQKCHHCTGWSIRASVSN